MRISAKKLKVEAKEAEAEAMKFAATRVKRPDLDAVPPSFAENSYANALLTLRASSCRALGRPIIRSSRFPGAASAGS